MDVQGAEIAFSPGFRWGTSLLPGDAITRELMMDQVAITYPYATLTPMSGEMIKTILEDVADNLFNPDPYYQQGGDMVRVGGLQYTMTPGATMGSRISDMRLNGKPIEADKTYKVAGWAPVAEEAKNAGNKPVWELRGDLAQVAVRRARQAAHDQHAQAGRRAGQPGPGLSRISSRFVSAAGRTMRASPRMFAAVCLQGAPWMLRSTPPPSPTRSSRSAWPARWN